MNEQSIPWDDLRTILAIARARSLSGAARKLGVSHATVFRRLEAIEARLGVRLFDRARSGYTPTAAGEEIADSATRIESEVAGVERRIAGRDLLPAGPIRLTTTDALLGGLLSPILARFLRSFPDISLEVAVSATVFSLAKREADIAIRPTRTPPENLVGRRIGCIRQAVYGTAEAADGGTHGRRLTAFPWVGPDERMGYTQLESWMHEQRVDAHCRYRVDTMLGMRDAVLEGLGVAVLPCYLGDGDQRLMRIGEPIAALSVDLWLLMHADLRNVNRIRTLSQFLAAAVGDLEDVLSGGSAPATSSHEG